jgi:hypothetical protein
MLDGLFWWTGVALWVGIAIGTASFMLIDAHDKSIRERTPNGR